MSKVFDTIVTYFKKYHCVPSYRELSRLQGWSSPNAALTTYDRLVRAGLLVRLETPGGLVVHLPVGVYVLNVSKAPVPRKPRSKS
jgi:hypothetical protein